MLNEPVLVVWQLLVDAALRGSLVLCIVTLVLCSLMLRAIADCRAWEVR